MSSELELVPHKDLVSPWAYVSIGDQVIGLRWIILKVNKLKVPDPEGNPFYFEWKFITKVLTHDQFNQLSKEGKL